MSLIPHTPSLSSRSQALDDPYANFPEELKAQRKWVTWQLEDRQGKPTKVPFNPVTGKRASSTDPSTWTTFENAINASGYTGIGCIISPPFVGVDIDKVRDPQTGFTEPWAANLIRELDSYTELSPSGRGYHVWVKDRLAVSGTKKSRVEMYGQGRYFTVTGDHVHGTPYQIHDRDLSSFHARLAAGQLEPDAKSTAAAQPVATAGPTQPKAQPDLKHELLAGRWQENFKSQSEADLALCNMLVADFNGDAQRVDAAFRQSGLYRAKWDAKHGAQTYGQRTIEVVLTNWREEAPNEIEEAAPEPYPNEIIDGDYIGDLTRALTDGTPIPPAFTRQIIKTVLGALLNGHVGFPGHEDLHLRQYSINVSLRPQSGKGESWKRVAEYKTGVLNCLLQIRDSSSTAQRYVQDGVVIVEGGQFGSGEKLPKLFENSPRILARFDEMSELFQKFRTQASTLEDKLTQLYERQVVSSGSLTNGEHECRDAELSFVGDFTADKFHSTFIGRGSGGSGFLSRNVITYCDRAPFHGKDWAAIDPTKITRILGRIRERLDTLQHLKPSKDQDRFIPHEDDAARQLRYQFYAWLDAQDLTYTGRLSDHFKRDLLLRALFAHSEPEHSRLFEDEEEEEKLNCQRHVAELRITADMTRRSIAWAKRQLQDRIKLWPADMGSLAEIMERKIIEAVKKHRLDRYEQRKVAGLTDRELVQLANVAKPGSGGHETFNRAKKALLASRTLRVAGNTRTGSPIYDTRGG